MNEYFQYWTRRIIAWVLVAASASVLTILSLNGAETALVALISLTGTVVGFYFGTRSNGGTNGVQGTNTIPTH